MRGRRTIAGNAAALVAGTVAGSVVALGISAALGRAVRPPTVLTPQNVVEHALEDAATPPRSRGRDARLLLAWASGSLPARAEAAVEKVPGVRSATTVETGTDWLREVSPDATARGRPSSSAIPLEVAVIEPREYAPFVPPAERNALLGLGAGDALIARSAGALSVAAADGEIQLVDRSLRAHSTIGDVAANGYEALLAGEAPSSWARTDRFLLIYLRDAARRSAVEQRIRTLLRPGQALRVRAKGETPFLRYGDAVLPQLLVKKTFGEFPVVVKPDGWVEVDPTWKHANIRSARVPILGQITCHRTVIPQLRDAMLEIDSEGLGHLLDRGQYGGCFGPRFIGLEPGGRLSHHTWGIAIDLNVADNAFGTKSDQDPRLVSIMESHGFTWGGRWLVPDGMHFEWVRFP
ncbi:MAG: M15 family metallopeptidase [Actinomycetota bacterium]|nr:M15 family metallopeptidase [Actinomycetota bacterium]